MLKHPWLLPLSWIYLVIVTLRRSFYQWGWLKVYSFDTPVIVVGNILVGGTGKTPFVIALVEYLQAQGLKVGVVSRGYKAGCKVFPHEVLEDEPAAYTGDEPALIKLKTGAWVVIDPQRPRAVQWLIDTYHPDVIISDDGLQHYALKPGLSLVVHPQGLSFYPHLLPAGPLREPLSRLKSFDLIVDDLVLDIAHLELDPSWRYNLVTGIARPERAVTYLHAQGIDFEHHAYADHHEFVTEDFLKITGPIIMTEKDEIKCRDLIISQPIHVIRVKTKLSEKVIEFVNRYLGIKS